MVRRVFHRAGTLYPSDAHPGIPREKLCHVGGRSPCHRYLGKGWNYCQGFDLVDETMALDEDIYRGKATGRKLAKISAEWIAEHADERFFTWIHIMDPHKQYVRHRDGTDFGDRPIDRYDGEIEYSDKAVGYILDKLDELGIAQTTTVVILADHGEFFGEHGRTTHGGSGIWEEGARIPLIIKSPGLKPGVSKCITPHIDIDSHADHKYTSIAILEVMKNIAYEAKLLLYTNHLSLSETYPIGEIHSSISLPPNRKDFYFDSLLNLCKNLHQRDAKRAIIEHYVSLLEKEGRLHKDFNCFLCEKKVENRVAFARSFLVAHENV